MASEVNVLECGTAVSIGDSIDGTVTAVCVRSKNVTYEVRWWNGREHRCEWLEAEEVQPKHGSESLRIGFKIPERPDLSAHAPQLIGLG